MKKRRLLLWTLPTLALIIAIVIGVTFATGYQYIVIGVPIKEQEVMGMSREQIRKRFGEPDWAIPGESSGAGDWVYYHGMIGGGTSLEFEDDRVVAVHVRRSK